MGLVAHQRGAGMPIDHLFDRTTEIYVDDPRPAVGIELGGLGHDPRLTTGQLHGHRLLIGAAFRHRHRLTSLADHRLTGDHLGNDETGTEPLDEPAERQIADPRHRSEDDRIVQTYRDDGDAHRLRNYALCLSNRQMLALFILRCNINA